ncbi:MAG: BLUF domain-containing protein [Verrucomicrobiota bacterium]
MYTLVYSSRANYLFAENELIDLLKKARQFNSVHGITGMLLYHNESFLQVLEGEEKAVFDLYETRIKEDDRHSQVELIADAPVQERVFDEWLMGFNYLRDTDAAPMEGFTTFLETGRFSDRQIVEDPNLAQELLLLFRDSKF